ncbi:hypothetical protein E4T42_04288 [Aureobasidium subglaciale]|uniref:Uncharacterized protein n=1 Tax=Aureobasidium subglaciale (strain EXF-2481) TaxID=1043005 RepID=A0A074YIA4_AURSE|nr:uncharacterized protein AUEXF2481DRAFT_29218 [Aureobasidium subglaciale EXF-2481]KAI5201700.1 hypothetical protein E4T38_05916 [Aureobasidium subglaciale]KAI5220598.1 hypothetical protein E4T40_05847 [Aureobasidium subglaciale]KAI5224292.1 hypothetical protein E4T41_05777 [Aureobasidium subglaciale]KAI5251350.1 hypothetical protein E4T42_04288 [Aureobasidium subglaciale]KAI5260790.1 hypothetical protein E4T46_05748 [Aureobasidium subglaciale]
MSHPQEPTRQPTVDETERYKVTLHRAAIACLFVCPALAALPPRKLDFYTISLIGMTGFSGNYLYRESQGQSIWKVIGGSKAEDMRPKGDTSLPTDKAREFQRQMKLQREARTAGDNNALEATQGDKQNILEQVYYGKEKPEGWRERRAQEDQKALAEGKGLSDIILDQIWDVWTWGKHKEAQLVAEVKSEGDKKN